MHEAVGEEPPAGAAPGAAAADKRGEGRKAVLKRAQVVFNGGAIDCLRGSVRLSIFVGGCPADGILGNIPPLVGGPSLSALVSVSLGELTILCPGSEGVGLLLPTTRKVGL